MASEKPERIRWAVEVLSVQSKERILEIGCGNGHAVELICKKLTTGKIVGIDRSAKAIHIAETNNQQCIHSGKAQFLNAALAEIKLNAKFDKIFAVNVNVFWIDPDREIATIHTLLNQRGRLYLFYEPPSASQVEKVVENSQKHLQAKNFKIVEVLRKRLTSNYGVCIIAKK